MQHPLSAEERALERALEVAAERKKQASLRHAKGKKSDTAARGNGDSAPQSLPVIVPPKAQSPKSVKRLRPISQPAIPTKPPSPIPIDQGNIKIMSDDEYNSSDFDSDDCSDCSDDASLNAMPLDSDGLPSLVRMMSLKSLDENDPTESDTDDEEEDGTGDKESFLDKVKAISEDISSEDDELDSNAENMSETNHLQHSISSTRRESRNGHAKSTCSSLSCYSSVPFVDNTVLDGIQVRKYFGKEAKEKFSSKVSWMNRQHVMHDIPTTLLPLAASSPSSVRKANQVINSKRRTKTFKLKKPVKLKKLSGEISSIRSFHNPTSGARKRSDSVGSVSSIGSMSSLRSGISLSNCTRHQLVFDDHEDLDSDIYSNHKDFNKGAALDIESLLYHLAVGKGKKENKSKLILEAMNKREVESNDLIANVRATTPDLSAVPSQGCGLNEVQSSPRSLYIAGCLSERLNPRAAYVIRSDISQELHLEHFGMGDIMAEQLAPGIRALPMLFYINISDNNLTDKGMEALLSSVIDMPMLTVLNMSDNEIGPVTAKALQEYLSGEERCPLQTLILKNANVDDFEGAMFIRSLQNNKTLTELNLSNNLIGGAEILNVVQPDLITAVESLADLIQNSECVLKTVELAWNCIRLDSSVYFAKAMRFNASIQHLDLSYNSLADDGGRAIGEALLENNTLTTLMLSNNNIGPAASFIICTAVEQNTCLRKLVLDGNPVGESGAKAIMNLPNVMGSRLDVSAAGCNVSMRANDSWFDVAKPCRTYKLKMSNSYDRAVAFKLLTVCAHHHSYIFTKFNYEEKGSKPVKIKLKQKLLRERIKFLTKKEKKVLAALYKIKDAAHDVSLAQRLFAEYDTDHSGEIDVTELKELLDSFGMVIKADQLGDAMSVIDIDGSGGIELPEFLNFIRDHRNDAVSRIKEMTVLPTMVEEGSSKKYIPPTTGTLIIDLRDGFVKKEHYQVMTSSDQKNVNKLAARIGTCEADLIRYSFCTSKMRLVEAYEFYEAMIHDMGNKARVLSHILPHMIVPAEARTLVSKVTLDDASEMKFVRMTMGNSLRPIFGLPCGFYDLDFTREMDQLCLGKLLELEGIIVAMRRINDPFGLGVVGDTSQYRNWSCFRNCYYNGSIIKITADLFTPMPKTGKLQFDFSGSIRPKFGQHSITDRKMTKVLINLALVKIERKAEPLQKLNMIAVETEAVMCGKGTVYFECDKKRAEKIALASDNFYRNIPNRVHDMAVARKKEEIKFDISSSSKNSKRRESNTNYDPFMSQKDDQGLANEVSSSQGESFTKSRGKLGTSLVSTLKAKRCIGLFKGHGNFASFKVPGQALGVVKEGVIAEDDVSEFHDEEEEQEKANYLAAQQEIREREERLAARSKHRMILKIESLRAREMIDEDTTDSENREQSPDGSKSVTDCNVNDIKSKIITLPAITVEKNGKMITYPAVVVEKPIRTIIEVDANNVDIMKLPTPPSSDMSSKKSSTPDKALQAASGQVFMPLKDYQDGGTVPLDQKTLQQTKNRRKLRDLLTANDIKQHAKGVRLKDEIISMLGPLWLRVKHVVLLLQYFKEAVKVGRTKSNKNNYWGSYRVDIVVSLFSRIVDLHNFEFILAEMSSIESSCLYTRLGWLNIFNPMKPEGCYELSMSRWDERMVAKLLLSLAVHEVGENLIDGSFQWDRDAVKTPGWVVTPSWLCDESMQRRGYLTLTYVSKKTTSSITSDNYNPDTDYRRALLSAVLIREEELRKEVEVDIMPTTPGKETLKEYEDHWREYLYGDRDVVNKIIKITESVHKL